MTNVTNVTAFLRNRLLKKTHTHNLYEFPHLAT